MARNGKKNKKFDNVSLQKADNGYILYANMADGKVVNKVFTTPVEVMAELEELLIPNE